MKSRHVLVTGFKPFLGETENPSERLLPRLAMEPNVRTLTLPVEYRRAFEVLKSEFQRAPADAILLLGQAAAATRIRLERVALNLMDASAPDEAGELALETPVAPGAPLALATSVPLREWWQKLNAAEDYEISNSAGAFVCNSTYYLTLREFGAQVPCVFVHVPPLPTQGAAARRPGTRPMELDRMTELVLPVLRLLRDY